MPETTKQGILIIRVSDPRQEREGLSLDNQENVLRTYALEAGIKIVKEFRFQESADLKIRRRFQEVIHFVRQRKNVTCIIGYRVDRMTRNYHDHVLLDQLRLDEGKELHFVHDRLVIERSTVGREIQEWDTKVYLAKMYLNRLKEDALVSFHYKVSRGELPGKAPFGYRNVKVDHRSTVVIDPFEAEIVKKIFTFYASGAHSMLGVRKRILEDYGYKLSNGKLDHILKNSFYYGEMLCAGKRYQHGYERLISYQTYEAVVMHKASYHKQPHKFAGLDFPYRGVITCATCGCTITPERTQKPNGATYHYYHCTEYNGRHEAPWFTEADLTSQFEAVFDGLKIPKEQCEDLETWLHESHGNKVAFASAQRNELQQQHVRYEQRMKVLYDDRVDNIISKELYLSRKEEYEAEIGRISNKLRDFDEADADYYQNAIYFLDLCRNAGELFRQGSSETKRTLIKMALQNLRIDQKTLLWELKKPFDTVFQCVSNQEWLRLWDMFREKEIPPEINKESIDALFGVGGSLLAA